MRRNGTTRIPGIFPAAVMFLCGTPLDAAGQELLFSQDSRAETMADLAGAFSCPVDKLIALYSSLAPAELPAMLAVESEVLLICAERQERLRAIMTAEIELRELMDIPPPLPGAPRVSVAGIGREQLDSPATTRSCPASPPEDSGEPERVAEAEDAAGSDAAGTLVPPVTAAPAFAPDTEFTAARPAAGPAAGEAGVLSGLLAAALTSLADSAAGAAAPAAQVQACGEWSWIWTVRTSLGGRIAGLRDGSGNVIEVKEQDRLDGGLVVSRIGREGVFVQDGGGRLVPLPRAAAAGSTDGAGQGEVPGDGR